MDVYGSDDPEGGFEDRVRGFGFADFEPGSVFFGLGIGDDDGEHQKGLGEEGVEGRNGRREEEEDGDAAEDALNDDKRKGSVGEAANPVAGIADGQPDGGDDTEETDKRVKVKWHKDLLDGINVLTVPGMVDGKSVDLKLVPWSVRANRSDDSRWVIYLPVDKTDGRSKQRN